MNSFQLVVGIFGGKLINGELAIQLIYGTASRIGETKFITAAHVIHSAMQNEVFGVLFKYPDEDTLRTVGITNSNLFVEIDVATFDCVLPHIQKFELCGHKLPLLTDVYSIGFPYALNINEKIIDLRAFKGYVVGNHKEFFTLKGKPRISELSFHCPRGLSGAPVFTTKDEIAGIVIGNSITEMTIYTEKEKLLDGKETHFEKTESMHLGIMVRSDYLIDIGIL